MKIFKLINRVQNYAWGSKSFIPEILGIEQNGKSQAELWMGAHPKASSKIVVDDREISLLQLIESDADFLGKRVQQKFKGKFPFLFKILAAAEPLSIQAHPDKLQAEKGFIKENNENISLSDFYRNYKDDNHKPELICALTDFEVMCGFQPLAEIAERMQYLKLGNLRSSLAEFISNPSPKNFKALFIKIISDRDPAKSIAKVIDKLIAKNPRNEREKLIWHWLKKLNKFYPNDPGVLAPLYLNIVKLKPGEALYLDAGILHAYLFGNGIEIMANSDNVLRGGLTTKNMDIAELLKVLKFENKREKILLPKAINDHESVYKTPASEFQLVVVKVNGRYIMRHNDAPEIVLCTQGFVAISGTPLGQGESAVITGCDKCIISGEGTLYRATVPLKKEL